MIEMALNPPFWNILLRPTSPRAEDHRRLKPGKIIAVERHPPIRDPRWYTAVGGVSAPSKDGVQLANLLQDRLGEICVDFSHREIVVRVYLVHQHSREDTK